MRAPMTGPVRDLQQPGRTKANTNYFQMALVQMESYAGETRRLRSTFNGDEVGVRTHNVKSGGKAGWRYCLVPWVL